MASRKAPPSKNRTGKRRAEPAPNPKAIPGLMPAGELGNIRDPYRRHRRANSCAPQSARALRAAGRHLQVGIGQGGGFLSPGTGSRSSAIGL